MAKLSRAMIVAAILWCGIVAGEDVEEAVGIAEEARSTYRSPRPMDWVYLEENFDDPESVKGEWVKSEAKKEGIEETLAKYDGTWSNEKPKLNAEKENLGLVLKSRARHAAISRKLRKPFNFQNKPLIVQYEVIFQEDQECGGAYLKLLSDSSEHKDLKTFHDKTPYSIMFGPDKCGPDTKLHFIFRHKNPLNGSIEEKHSKKPKEKLDDIFKDKQPHLFTLIVRPNNLFEVKVDNKVVNSGSLLEDVVPPVNPPMEIEDPDDKKPSDWDDREKIPDPMAVKPEDWDEDAPAQIVDEDDVMPDGWLEDEPSTIPNPNSAKPDDWDNDMDGEWEPPEISNPNCADAPGCGPYKKKLKDNPRFKGKWFPPLISNPNYKGKWKPKLIPNPNYFNDAHPFRMASIHAIGFELWSMSPDIYFDNIIVSDNETIVEQWAKDSFELRKKRIAEESWSVWYTIAQFTAERPWMWAVYIVALAIPVLLIFYCCCFDKESTREEEEQHLLPQEEEDQNSPSQEEEIKEDREEETEDQPESAEMEELEDKENDEEDDEAATILDSEKDKPLVEKEGPRRRKPNKA